MRLIVAAEFRRQRAPLALLAVLVAVWLGTMVTAAAGARRTDASVESFERRTVSSDASFHTTSHRPQDANALRRAVEALPAVVESDEVWYATTGVAYDRGVFVTLIAPTRGVWGVSMDRPIVLDGRLADASRADEVVVTSDAADLLNVGLGDDLSLPTWDKAELEAWYFGDRGAYPAFNGPSPTVEVVGIVRVASDITETSGSRPRVLATPAFHERWADDIGSDGTVMAVRLRHGADIEGMVADLTSTVDLTIIGGDPRADLDPARRTTRALSVGLWVLAAAVVLSGGLLLALAITRELRQSVDHYPALAALGMTRAQQTLALITPIGIAVAGGALVAAVGAIVASAWFPIGLGRIADPNPGTRPDWPLLGVASLLPLFVVAIAAAAVGARPPGRRGATRFRGGRGGIVDVLGNASALGVIGATERGRRMAVPVTALTIAGLVATASLAASARDLRAEPARWGYSWSSSPEIGFPTGQWSGALDRTMENPSLEGISTIAAGEGFIDEHPFTIAAIDVHRGVAPGVKVLAGRSPGDQGEIALGENVARALHARVGDRVRVGSKARAPSRYTVVGIVVPPATLGASTPGNVSLVVWPAYAFDLQMEEDDYRRVAIVYSADAKIDALEKELAVDPGWVFDGRSHAEPPSGLTTRLAPTMVLPWLGAFFLVFGGGAGAVVASRRSPRQVRELAILRAIGFARRDVRRFAIAESIVLVIVASIIGLALGLRSAITTWELVMGDLGIDDRQSSFLPPALGPIGVVAVVFVVASLMSARRASGIGVAAAILQEGERPHEWRPGRGRGGAPSMGS